MLNFLKRYKGCLWFFLALSSCLIANRALAYGIDETVNILEAGADSQQAVSRTFDQMWEDILTSSLYDTIATLGALAAVLLILVYYIDFYEKLQESGSWAVFLKRIVWLIVVFSLLINEAALFRTFTITLRDVWNGINTAVLEEPLIANKELLNAYNEVTGGITLQQYYTQKVTQCQALPDVERRDQCIENAKENVNQIAQRQNYSSNVAQRVLNGFGAALANAIEQQMTILMLSFAIAIQWLVEICWILTALVGPIFLGLSLLPVSQKGLFGWLIAFCSIGFYKLCFNILVGLVAYLNGQAPTFNGLLFSVAVGLLCPILAFVLAAGGGMSIFTSLASAGGTIAAPVASAAGGLAVKGGMIAGRAAGGLAAKGATSAAKGATSAARGGARVFGHNLGRASRGIGSTALARNVGAGVAKIGTNVGNVAARVSQIGTKVGNTGVGRVVKKGGSSIGRVVRKGGSSIGRILKTVYQDSQTPLKKK